MNDRIPCFLSDSDDARLYDAAEASNEARQIRIEGEADWMLSECKDFNAADRINRDHDLYDGDLLPNLMTEIANWTGRSDDAAERMRKLHNLLADEFQKIAEREVEA